ncbi:MAG: DUF262 domain-containing protein [Desulfobulbaceae bacterium]|nr:DUF262 domain-containing protein [Desulfobulbaceae bacterium]
MPGMNFNTTNNTFRQLMGNGLLYRVPPFQRDYSWSNDEWDDLWQDITALRESGAGSSHYLGYLVLQSSDSKHFDIIDGQQRITTLSVLTLAAIALLQEQATEENQDDRKRAEQLRSSYIGYLDPVTLIPQAKLTLNRHNDRFYQNYLVPLERLPQRGLNTSEHLLRKAFIWFRDRLKDDIGTSGKEVVRFIDSIVDLVFFTVITVTDELNAFTVFETLNARGVRLSATDLLKNYLFSVVSREGAHDTELQNLEERWEGIVGLLGSESFPEFLRIFWNSRHKLVRKSHLFKTIRRDILTKGDTFTLIRELDNHARIYAALRNPQESTWDTNERDYLRQLQMFNVRQPLALLLAAYDRLGEDDRDGFRRILRTITIISFRYNVICNLPSNEQEKVYNNIAQQISAGTLDAAGGIIQALQPIYPEDRIFRTAFAEKELRTTNSRNKKVVRYILFSIERHCSGSTYDFESATYSLEHILPEHPEQGWDIFDDTHHTRCVYLLGNMALLAAATNRELGNKSYQEKKEIYLQSEFDTTRGISKHFAEWTPDTIRSRQSWMAKQACSKWSVSFS